MKTTIEVDVETRDLVRAVSRDRHTTFDETIQRGLAALRREEARELMRQQSAAAAQDPADLAESRRVLAQLESWSPG